MSSSKEPASRFNEGDIVAERYVIERLLGQGGMGEVYAARDRKLRRVVAIKTIRDTDASSELGRERLRREATMVAQLDHPGIVGVHDVLEEGESVLLVMEFVEGTPLRARMEDGPIPPREAARIVSALASALAAAHACGLVHRDVKPENVIVRADGRVALLDFGIAKRLGQREVSTSSAAALTDPGVLMGTPLYLAPEQARGGEISPATDQFSLAVIAYELVAGRAPWPLDNIARLIAAIISDAPAKIDAGANVGAEVEAVLVRALEKRPGDRFDGITDFAGAFALALGAPDEPGPFVDSQGLAKREHSPAAMTQPIAPALLASPALTSSRLASPPAPAASNGRWMALGALAIAVVAAVATASMIKRDAAPASSAAASPSGFRLADLPPSRTRVPAAADDYRRAVHDLARGDTAAAAREMDEALAADPDLATGHLQRFIQETYRCPTPLEVARPHFLAAKRERDALDDRDRDLLDALAPAIADPPDLRDVAARLHALAEKRPNDAQIADVLAIAENKLFHFRASAELFRRASALDPTESLPGVLALAQDVGPPTRDQIIDECLSKSDGNLGCRYERAQVHALAGACTKMEEDARAMITLNPDSPNGPLLLARALAGQRASREAIEGALGMRRPLLAENKRASQEIEDRIGIAAWGGDFAAALSDLDRLGDVDPVWSGEMRVRVLWEIGDRRASADAALAYIKRSAALPRFERPESDPTPFMLARALGGGAITDEDRAARREAWIDGWKKRLDAEAWPAGGPVVWSLAFASPSTDAEARAAVDRLPSFGALPPMADRQFWTHDGPTGELLRRAARLDDAIPRLRSEASRCSIELQRVDAELGLGLALEAKGDKDHACASYRVVIDQWGAASPRSTSAEIARDHAKKLACSG